MLTLHHLSNSQSFRILWLLEEIQMEYELKIYQRTKAQLAPPEFKAISPLGTSPTITDGDVTLSESNAIIEYILDKHQAQQTDGSSKSSTLLRPEPGSPERTNFLFWFHTSGASFQAVLGTDTIFRILPSKVPFPISFLLGKAAAGVKANYSRPRLLAILDLAESQLSQHDFFAGDHLTAADITLIYSMDSVFARSDDLLKDEKGENKSYPSCLAWLERMRARPAYQAAQKKAGEEALSLSV